MECTTQRIVFSLLAENTKEELEAKLQQTSLLAMIMRMATPADQEGIERKQKVLIFEHCLKIAIAYLEDSENQPQA